MGRNSLLVRNGLFLLGLAGAVALQFVLAINDVTGLRGPPRADNPFVAVNQEAADSTILALLATAALAATYYRKTLRAPPEVLGGVWVGLVLCGLQIWFS